ncbi:MAG: metallophosphatase family protein [Methanomassiliicoccales archaeon]|nr:metallophosphatase family protein [Methanomassiliicoccales archaeon]
MKVALISDVHSNLVALDAVLADIDAIGVEQIVSAGDIVGYYPYPNETIERFRSRNIRSILGNHDRAVIRINPVGMNKMAAEAVLWTSKHVSADGVDYLRDLKARMQVRLGPHLAEIYHGSPRDDDEYLYEIDAGPELLEMCECNLLVVGHTHIPFIKTLGSGTIVNSGSVGQPRDGDKRASYVLYDGDSEVFQIRRVEYEVEVVDQEVQRVGLPKFLGERLRHGF